MSRVTSSSVFFLLLLLLSCAVSTYVSRSDALEGETNALISGTSMVFYEDFEGTFPEPNWNYPYDRNYDNGSDYWDDTFMKSHGGSYSAWCAQVGDQLVGETIWSQDFEGPFPTTGWDHVLDHDDGNGEDYWDDTDYRAHGGSWSAWCAQVGTQLVGVDFVANYEVHKYDDYMKSRFDGEVGPGPSDRLIDLGYVRATLSFSYWLDCEYNYDYLYVIINHPLGGSGYLKEASYTGNSGGWQTATVEIGLTAMSVGFAFESDGSNHNFEGAYVDDLVLTGYRRVPNYQVSHYDDNMEACLYRPVDLSSCSSATLSYWYWVDSEYGYDYLVVMYSIGSDWYYDYDHIHQGNSGGWQYSETAIPLTANYVGFYFRSDSSNHNYEGAYVDDVMLVGVEKPGTLVGTITEIGTGTPIAGASVTVGAQETLANASGYYKFELEAGTYQIIVRKAHYYPVLVDGVSVVNGMTTIQDIVLMPGEPSVESCDQSGTDKNYFDSAETVYAYGAGYLPNFLCPIYLVEDTTWTDGKLVTGGVTLTTTYSDSTGHMTPSPIYYPPTTPGKYDIIVDVNDNGKYDVGIDALDDNDVEVTAGIVVPEFTSFLILVLFMVTTMLAVTSQKRKSSKSIEK